MFSSHLPRIFARGRARQALFFVAALALLLSGSCARRQEPTVRRVAILPFEFQGTDASLTWLADALTAAALEQARGLEKTVALRVVDENAAALGSATEVVRGIVGGTPDAPSLTLYHERPVIREVAVAYQGAIATPSESLVVLRHALEAVNLAGVPFSTSNANAFRHFGLSLRASDLRQAEGHLLDALKTDPLFATASLRLAALLVRTGNPGAAAAELERLISALPADRSLPRAYAHLELASLRNDIPGVVSALEDIVKAVPDDLDARNRLATIYFQQRRYPEASKAFDVLTDTDPANASFWNQASYSHAYAGNREAAMAALRGYRSASADANVEDSEGDIHFFFGDFAAAAASYQAAHAKSPEFLGGFSQFKAAWAWLLAADFAKADEAANTYVGGLRKTNAPLADFRSAQWQYLRGRRQEARSAVEAMRGQRSYPQAYLSLLASQLYFWDAAEQGVSAFRFASAESARYGTSVRPIVAAMARGTEAGLAPAERANRIAPLSPQGQQALFVAAAIFLSAQATDTVSSDELQALQLADGAGQESRAMVTHAMLGWALLKAGQSSAAAELFARRVPPSPEDDGLLWPLVFPAALSWEMEACKQAGKQPPAPQLKQVLSQVAPGA